MSRPEMTMPLVGLLRKEVTLTLRNFSAVLHGPLAYLEGPTYDLRGVVLWRPTWEADADMFGFGVIDDKGNRRVIHIRDVVAVDGVKLQPRQEELKPRAWEVKSSNGKDTYTVTRDANGRWSCPCVAFSSFHKVCRHIKEAQSHENRF